MDSDKLLGEFLRARREVTTPEQVGLLDVGVRRTPGLRREEVAMLAGVSTDYYVRLEQGRERRPSDQVLTALARVLCLGPDATDYLYELAHPLARPHRQGSQLEQVSPELLRLMRGWSHIPAFVTGRWLDVLARNPLGSVLHDGLEYADNLLRLVFLDPSAREFYPDWEQVARVRVAHLRGVAGTDLDHPYLIELVGELSLKSADFRRLWARHDVSGIVSEDRRFHHRKVGELDLTSEVLSVASAPGQQLAIFHAKPGSSSERALVLLANLAALTR
ncbi:helix-turn-helix transcriptional regulator [Streptosporangium subroseum]|uniref:helix-turn-helix transcriptional regulator n=1 Tax=Streptosporangium subroseum TaxID=106412 RepID=UPI0030908295|nr:helix-turn-helix transcriptional regulator [Streptosporangium subroseum]